MDELIEHVSTTAGLEPEVSRKAIALILAFLQREGPPAEVGRLMDALPGARDAVSATATEEQAGPDGGGLMGLAGQLAGIGLGIGEMQTVGQELFTLARAKVGENALGTIVGAIPGLEPFV